MIKNIPLILASNSAARKTMLANAGLKFKAIAANIDEAEIKDRLISQNIEDAEIALRLAEEKAKKISNEYSDYYIIGSDQILVFNDQIYDKAKNIDEAKARLLEFQGQSHSLISAICVYKSGKCLWTYHDRASLHMHALTPAQIEDYINAAGDIVTSCVGCYALEGVSIQLFSKIEGDYFTILGMPLLALLNFLHDIDGGNT
ncbi:MAG: Maf family protein [Alphaproteobacteria bacterium]|nr:Maf family protein [Alphaproteobacteria bacterium]